MDLERVPTPDGRTLDVYRAGSARDEVLLFHDGTPGAGIVSNQFLATVAEHDLQFVAFSRAGYGGSTRRPGRSVADVADDVGTVLDHIGATQCYEIGFSGGGPHCLATAALMPERVKAGAVVGSVAPFGAVGLEYLAGMGAENIEEFGAALAGSETLQAFLDGWLPSFVTVSGEQIADALGDLVPPVDRAALTGDFAESVAADIRQGLSGGIWGWHDDDLAFVRPWGFDLTTLRVPFALWQGEEDRMVPFAHGAWLAHHVPGVRAHLLPDHGHLSLAVASLGWILDDLLSSTSH